MDKDTVSNNSILMFHCRCIRGITVTPSPVSAQIEMLTDKVCSCRGGVRINLEPPPFRYYFILGIVINIGRLERDDFTLPNWKLISVSKNDKFEIFYTS